MTNLIIIAAVAVVTNSLNQVLQEKTVHKYGTKIHGVVKFPIMSAISLILILIYKALGSYAEKLPVQFNYHFDVNVGSILNMSIIIIATILITYLFNKLLERKEMYTLNIFFKLTIVVVMVIDILRGDLQFSLKLLFYVIVFLVGLFFILDIHKIEKDHIKSDLEEFGTVAVIFALMVAIPYFISEGMGAKGWYNPETLLLYNGTATGIVFYALFKPKIENKLTVIKDYFMQSLVCSIGGIALNLIIVLYGVFQYKIIEAFIVIGVVILSEVILKTKITIRKLSGVLIAAIGFLLISVNII